MDIRTAINLVEGLAAYHGTGKSFKAFRFDKSGTHPSKIGIWFASTSDAAAHIAKLNRDADADHRVIEADLELGNVMKYGTYGEFLEAYRDAGQSAPTLRKRLMRKGFNSIEITHSDTDGAGERTDWAVFEPWQIQGMSSAPVGKS